MRVFVAGASGALGRRLVTRLVGAGHEVTGTFRSAGHGDRVSALGAEPVQLDLLNAAAVAEAVRRAEPDAIVHQATALAGARFGRSLDRTFVGTNQLRTAGTDALVAAAQGVGVRRIIAQSFAPYRYAHVGGPVKSEQDPLEQNPPAPVRQTFAAMNHLDDTVTRAGGISLRYGLFYGDTDETTENGMLNPIRKRRYPVIGDGGGIVSFVHLDDAAAATALALEWDGSGVFNIVDDEPAAMRDWVPFLARVLGAPPPRRIPLWLATVFAGGMASLLSSCRGASNALAKEQLGWAPGCPTWRMGFPAAYG